MERYVALTVAEVCALDGFTLTERQLHELIRALRIQPVGLRRQPPHHVGRPWNTYDSAQLLKLHAALLPFLGLPVI